MDRSRYFVILVLGALLGASIEYLKDVNPQSAKIARLQRLEALMDGGKVVYQPFAKRSVIKSKTLQGEVAGLEAPPSNEKSQKEIAPAKKEDAKKKDEKKKKDDKKKKKKKKTIKGKGTPETDDSEEADDSAESPDSSSPTAAGGPAPRGGEENKEPETVEEWVAFLMSTPDFEKTAKFVKLYQGGAIIPDIYYEVVTAMLGDEREKMREYGIMALGSTPSVRSFTMLADYTTVEQGLTRPKQQANAYIRMYTRLEYLQHLVGAVKSGSPEAGMQAMQQLQVAASIHLKGSNGEPGEAGETPRTPASNVSRYFNPVVEALQQFVQTTQNQALVSEANSTLNTIRTSMGS